MRSCYLLLLCLLSACKAGSQQAPAAIAAAPVIAVQGKTLQERFSVPEGYSRVTARNTSFAAWLRQLPLRPDGTEVHLYNGAIKANKNAYCAVVDMDIGKQDLQQCADAVMRLRGEYLYSRQNWHELGFMFLKDGRMHYFTEENRQPDYKTFRSWMNKVFAYGNTQSLQMQLHPKKLRDIMPGDVLIQSGPQSGNRYGHAVIVADVAENTVTGDRMFMLAQSYMPAQDIQVLRNPAAAGVSPWYSIAALRELIVTPEWTFSVDDLRCF